MGNFDHNAVIRGAQLTVVASKSGPFCLLEFLDFQKANGCATSFALRKRGCGRCGIIGVCVVLNVNGSARPSSLVP